MDSSQLLFGFNRMNQIQLVLHPAFCYSVKRSSAIYVTCKIQCMYLAREQLHMIGMQMKVRTLFNMHTNCLILFKVCTKCRSARLTIRFSLRYCLQFPTVQYYVKSQMNFTSVERGMQCIHHLTHKFESSPMWC